MCLPKRQKQVVLGEAAGRGPFRTLRTVGRGGGCLPLVLLDEEAQLGSGSAQKALHTGL